MYYNLILDQLINGYEQDYDDTYFQSQVDELLKKITYSEESIAADIISTRRIVEIVSDLQMFDVEISLTKAQRNKIESGIEKLLKRNDVCTTVLINDIYIVDRLLALKIVGNDKIIEVYEKLTVDGGTCAAEYSGVKPDINTTYQFYVTLSRMGNYMYYLSQQEFVHTLKIKDGVYAYDKEKNYVKLSTIYFANVISNTRPGGDKFD